jgi:hypothetical protein
MFTIYSTGKISSLHSLRLSPMSNIGLKLTRNKVPQRSLKSMGPSPLGIFFVDAVKEQYYHVGNYDD